MRPRHQRGSIVKRDGLWVLRYYEDRIEHGKSKRVRASKIVALVNNTYQVQTHVQPLADKVLKQVNGNQATHLDGTITLAEFVEQRYFPHLEPSTLRGYRDIWNLHGVNSDNAGVRVRDFTSSHAQSFLMSLNPKLTHQSHLPIKAFLSGVFNRARQIGAISGTNPLDGTKAGGARKKNLRDTRTQPKRLR
jgi:hypothetical protein